MQIRQFAQAGWSYKRCAPPCSLHSSPPSRTRATVHSTVSQLPPPTASCDFPVAWFILDHHVSIFLWVYRLDGWESRGEGFAGVRATLTATYYLSGRRRSSRRRPRPRRRSSQRWCSMPSSSPPRLASSHLFAHTSRASMNQEHTRRQIPSA